MFSVIHLCLEDRKLQCEETIFLTVLTALISPSLEICYQHRFLTLLLPRTVKLQPSPSHVQQEPLWTAAPSMGSQGPLHLRLYPQPNRSVQRTYTRLKPPHQFPVLKRAALQLRVMGNTTRDKTHRQNALRDKNFMLLLPLTHKYFHSLSTFPFCSVTSSPYNSSFDAYFLCRLAYMQVMTSTLWTEM